MQADFVRDVRQRIETPVGSAFAFNILKLIEYGYDVERLPFSIRVLLENALRNSGRVEGADKAVESLARWPDSVGAEIPFMPYRVLLQDFTGVPLVVDLAAMRDAAKSHGYDPARVNSGVPVDLVIDHSIQVDAWGSDSAFAFNLEKEYERNSERYSLLKWAQSSFTNMRVFPPGKGICHQFNLEYLAKVVACADSGQGLLAFPDTLVGTDSHTTMVNGLGVLGWGVGGIEAEAVMLGEPYHMPVPKVVGVNLVGSLSEGVTPTDLVLSVTERLRGLNVVGAFVEYFGEGYRNLSVPDRATLGNMSPEYGATVGYSPIDGATLAYLAGTARDAPHVDFVRRYATQLGFYLGDREPGYSEVIVVDLGRIEPSVAGPRNPEERRTLRSMPAFVGRMLEDRRSVPVNSGGSPPLRTQQMQEEDGPIHSGLADGSVVISAITSCTNTSNPTVMIGAGLLAKKAVAAGLSVKPWVKPSLAPGSTVVTDYLQKAGLLEALADLGYSVVGYGCTTCIGQSGPLPKDVEERIRRNDLYAVAVLSGNRNFDGRIHPLAKGSFLMSPMLVVAYGLAGRIDFDFERTPLGSGKNGRPVFLRDIWPSLLEIKESAERSLSADLFRKRYSDATKGDPRWDSLTGYADQVFHWDEGSTYIKRPPWFDASLTASAKSDIRGARAIAVLEDKVTTDHISPAATIPVDSPAGVYLTERGVDMVHFSSYGARRGNHEVMTRGGFSNIRLRNLLARGKEGGYTTHFPSGKVMPIFDAAMEYSKSSTPLIVLAGKQYGMGSSRDWAAKAPRLLGIRAVIAEDFERIHRSNLVAMGILPLQFKEGESRASLGLSGEETFTITGVEQMSGPRQWIDVSAAGNGKEIRFKVLCRVDNNTEMKYVERGGILPFVFDKLLRNVP